MRHRYSLLNIFSSEAVLNVKDEIYLIISYQWSAEWDAGDGWVLKLSWSLAVDSGMVPIMYLWRHDHDQLEWPSVLSSGVRASLCRVNKGSADDSKQATEPSVCTLIRINRLTGLPSYTATGWTQKKKNLCWIWRPPWVKQYHQTQINKKARNPLVANKLPFSDNYPLFNHHIFSVTE